MGKKARQKRLRLEAAMQQERTAPAARPDAPELAWATPAGASVTDSAPNQAAIAVALFVLALAVRGLFLWQLAGTPYTEVENIDSKGYVDWAQRILAGEWLPRRHFYQSPLYAYYLALVQAVAGDNHWIPRCLQIVAGSLSVVLVYFIALRIFSLRVAVLAALMLSFYGPLIAEEIMLAKTALVICLTIASIHLFLRGLQTTHQRDLFLAGIVFGVAIIGVGQWLPVLAALALYAAVTAGRAWRSLVTALVAGTALVMVPVVGWNSYWGGGLMLTSGDAGLNLFIGNNPLATGLPGRPTNLRDVPWHEEEDSKNLAEKTAGRSLTPAEVSQYWSRRAVQWALQNPGAFLSATWKKIIVLWNGFEVPDSYQYNFLRAYFLPWLWVCLSFAVIGPLALTGLILVAGHRPARPLYVASLTYLAVIALFYVRSRYRMPALPLLIVFAAAAVDWLLAAVQQRRWTALLAGLAALGATTAVVNHEYCEPGRSNAPAICLGGDAWFDLEWMKLAEWRQEEKDLPGTIAYLERAASGKSLRGPGQLFFWLAYSHAQLADQKRAAGDEAAAMQGLAAAAQAYERALALDYRRAATLHNLAGVYRSQGRLQDAIAAIERSAASSPKDGSTILKAVRWHVEAGDCAAAERWRVKYESLKPADSAARDLLATCR
jgi:4-amino-4-deoxy-L-arabinose transferase-like glycosyltransferase